jgi:hypothetical protein
VTLLGALLGTPTLAAGTHHDGASFYLDETFLPVYVNNNDPSSFNTAPGVATKSGLGFDFRTTAGYLFDFNLFVGGTYNTYSLSTKRAAVQDGDNGEDESTSRSEFGPTVGYFTGGWKFLLTYFLSGSRNVKTTNTNTDGSTAGEKVIGNAKMSGFQLSVGYSFPLGPHFEIGPSLVYRNVSYKTQNREDGGAVTYTDSELYSPAVDGTLSPMLSMTLRF